MLENIKQLEDRPLILEYFTSVPTASINIGDLVIYNNGGEIRLQTRNSFDACWVILSIY